MTEENPLMRAYRDLRERPREVAVARLFAEVPPGTVGKTKHQIGMPSDPDPISMPPARVLLAAEAGSRYFLYRFADDGEFAGDTLHDDLASLQEDAEWEYGRKLVWEPVPHDVGDPVEFALQRLAK